MFEKVNPQHPDKVADRIAGAIVDLAYAGTEGGFASGNPKIAVEVLIGHGKVYVIVETSLCRNELRGIDVEDAITRICGNDVITYTTIVPQDSSLADNQRNGLRCGDNGIFRGKPVTDEQKELTTLLENIYSRFPSDGKCVLYGDNLIICQSNAEEKEISDCVSDFYMGINLYEPETLINPLGYWTGGINVDSGATNRKLGSDMGDAVTGGGLHGKDLSKADVSVNIVCHVLAQQKQQPVEACCAIGDESVLFRYADGTTERMQFSDIVEQARTYILTECDGSFERLAEWGLIR